MNKRLIFNVLSSDPATVPEFLEALNARLDRRHSQRIEVQDRDLKGDSLLMIAITAGHTALVRNLAQVIDPTLAHAKTQETPLMRAASLGRVNILTELLSVSDPRAMDEGGNTALTLAASQGRVACVKALIETSDLNHKTKRGQTALMVACDAGHANVVKCLVAKSNLRDTESSGYGRNALTIAASRGHVECLHALLKAGAKDEPTRFGMTALLAAASHSLECVEALLPVANAKHKNNKGETALILAAENGQVDIVQRLLPLSEIGWKPPELPDAFLAAVFYARFMAKSEESIQKAATICAWLAPHGEHKDLPWLGCDSAFSMLLTSETFAVADRFAEYASRDEVYQAVKQTPERLPRAAALVERWALERSIKKSALTTPSENTRTDPESKEQECGAAVKPKSKRRL